MTENSQKIILDLCGGTGAWSRPYKEAGYDVRVCTLPDVDVMDIRFWADFYGHNDPYSICLTGYKDPVGTPLLQRGKAQYIDVSNVYGILAAPPCTEFSLAKNGSPTPRNLSAGMEVVEACERIIRHCMLHGNLKFWALENPVGLLRRFLGRPQFTFQQWQYGALAVKPTDIWGWFNPPTPTVKVRPDGIVKRYSSGKVNTFAWSAPKPPDWLDATGLTRADLRSITPDGFAQAFYKANR
jgi:hypothetical protein